MRVSSVARIIAASLLLAGLVNADPFQSRHLLEDGPVVLAVADTTTTASGGGAGGASLTIGTSSGTGALSSVAAFTGESMEVAEADTKGDAEVYADDTSTISVSDAYTNIYNEDRLSDADGAVSVMSQGSAWGEDFVVTEAAASAIYEEGPDFTYEEQGDFALAMGMGQSLGAAGGDSLAGSYVDFDASVKLKEEANDYNEETQTGQFGYALGEVVADGLTSGFAEADDSGSMTYSNGIVSAETAAVAAPGIAAVDSGMYLGGFSSSMGDVVAENDFTGYGEQISFATDNTLAPGVGIPVANAEDAKAITQTGVTVTALSDDEDPYAHSMGILTSLTYASAETGVVSDPASAAGQSNAVAGGNFGANGFAVGTNTEGTMFDTNTAGYFYAATEGEQKGQGMSYTETMAENSYEATASGSGTGAANSYGLSEVMAESTTGYGSYFFGFFEDEMVGSSSSVDGFVTVQANGEEDLETSAMAFGEFGGDVYHYKYNDDAAKGSGGQGTTLTSYELNAESSGEDGMILSSVTAEGGTDLSTYNDDGFGLYNNEAETIQALDARAVSMGDMTSVDGTTSHGVIGLSMASFFPYFPGEVLGSTGAFIDGDFDTMGSASGSVASEVDFSSGVSTATMADNAFPTQSSAEIGGGTDIGAEGDFIYSEGNIGTQAYSVAVGGRSEVSPNNQPNEYSGMFGATIIGAESLGGGLIGGADAASGESDFSLGAFSDAGVRIQPATVFSVNGPEGLEGTAEGYGNHVVTGSGATFLQGGVQSGLSLDTTTGVADLNADGYGNYAVGLGVAEGGVSGNAFTQGQATGFGDASLALAAGNSGATSTLAEANAFGTGAADADAEGYGVLSNYADAITTGYDTGVETGASAFGSLKGEAAVSVDGSGTAGDFESYTGTQVSNMGGGEDAMASSGTSAMVGGGALSYANPFYDALGTVITDVYGTGSGHSDVSPNGVVMGSTNSESTSDILDNVACEEDPDCSIVDGGFAAASAVGGGNANFGAFGRMDDESLTAEAEILVGSLGIGNAAALAVEEDSLGGGYTAASAQNVYFVDTESQIKPGGLGFTSERELEVEGERYWYEAVAVGEMLVVDTLNVHQDGEVTSDNTIGFLPPEVTAEATGFSDASIDVGAYVASIPQDEILFGAELTTEGSAEAGAFALANFDGIMEEVFDDFSGPMFQYTSVSG